MANAMAFQAAHQFAVKAKEMMEKMEGKTKAEKAKLKEKPSIN